MIKIELGMNVLTNKQIEDAADVLSGYDSHTIFKLANFACGVATKNTEKYKAGEIVPFQFNTENTKRQLSELDTKNFAYGAEGVKYLCDTRTELRINPVVNIDIPNDVFYECSASQWQGISSLAAKVETRNNRFCKMMELDAPMIIISNEYRMLREKVEILEANDIGKPERWNDGCLKRALNDVGFSLAYGWRPEMLDYFEKRRREWEAEENEDDDEIEVADKSKIELSKSKEGEKANG